ncbi:putative aryl-alcohol dehydrogenase Aad14 [Meredithblackwellia eburnea MCA 4105]
MGLFDPAPEPISELARYRILSPTCGLRVSPLCLGGMSFGSAWNDVMGEMTKEATFDLLNAYYEKGGNFIDTSNNYQDQQSELWIGEWMAKRKNRDELVLATKFTIDYKTSALKSGSVRPNSQVAVNYQGNHKKSLHLSVEDSLKKLGTSYIDILYLHWWDYTTSVEEVMQSLNALVQSGKVLYLGISDTPAWIVADANRYAKEKGFAQFVVYQGLYSVAQRDLERDVLPMAQKLGLAVTTWNSLGGGKFRSPKELEAMNSAGEKMRPLRGPDQTPNEVAISAVLGRVADEVGADSATAVALAYVIQKQPNMFPIVGGRKVAHLLANIEALKIRLSPEHVKSLEAALPFDIGFPFNFIGTDPHTNGGNIGRIFQAAGQYSFVQAPTAILPPGTK